MLKTSNLQEDTDKDKEDTDKEVPSLKPGSVGSSASKDVLAPTV